MSRPVQCRRIRFAPEVRFFKPAGTPLRCLEEVTLSMDELEALRLVDLEGNYQESAAESMGVSRPTLSRILAEARQTVAEALVEGKALRVDGGQVSFEGDSQAETPAGECGCRQGRIRRTCRKHGRCRRREIGSDRAADHGESVQAQHAVEEQ